MSCLWWTGSSQIFFEEIPFWKKVSSPHYLKMLMKLSKRGISYSLKRDLRSISKITFYGNWRVSSTNTEFDNFFKKRLFVIQISIILALLMSVGWVALIFQRWCSSLKRHKVRANTQIGTKCDFRDWPRTTFGAVAEAIFAWFD